jgi:hypothetical protein
MKRLALILTLGSTTLFNAPTNAQNLSKTALRDIDQVALKLADYSKELHAEFHEHLERVRHGEKLEADVSALEKIAERLHEVAHDADGSEQSILQIRHDTNELLQLSSQIGRTISLAERWVRTSNGRVGIGHMRSAAADVTRGVLTIDSFLPVDTQVIDSQADRLEKAVKELHSEFHEHLEGYEVSQHLDQDLENLEKLVEHMHDLTHGKAWAEINFNHLLRDIGEVKELTTHTEGLFVRQSRIGVVSRDYIGIEHSRDAITDVLSSAFLLEHMIRKSSPNLVRRPNLGQAVRQDRQRPRRDRLGYESQYRYRSDLHGLNSHGLNSHGFDLHDLHRFDSHRYDSHRDSYHDLHRRFP